MVEWVKWKVVILGGVLIIGFHVLSWILLQLFGFEIELLSSPHGYTLIILTGLLIAISAFLPYAWGKIVRKGGLFCLFVLLLLIQLNLLKPFVKATKIEVSECKVGSIFPSKEQLESGTYVYNALKFTSCVLTGYFPAEQGDLGWTAFYIFYIILPFAFAWVFLYGLMKSVMGGWFTGVKFDIEALLSFIIAVYAGRVALGGLLLEFAGYGAWGLVAMFLAVFFTKGLEYMMEKWYGLEEMVQTVRKVIEIKGEMREKARKTLQEYLSTLEKEKSPEAKKEKLMDLINEKSNIYKETLLWFPELYQSIEAAILIWVLKQNNPDEALRQVKKIFGI